MESAAVNIEPDVSNVVVYWLPDFDIESFTEHPTEHEANHHKVYYEFPVKYVMVLTDAMVDNGGCQVVPSGVMS